MIRISFSLSKTVRVKLNSDCQYKCKFCHQEGGIQTKNVDVKEVIAALIFFRKELNFTKVHFTGGEPTLYENLPHLLTLAKKLNFTTALTTNGQFETKTLRYLKKCGLDSINFSLHTMNDRAFLNIQDISLKTRVSWAK